MEKLLLLTILLLGSIFGYPQNLRGVEMRDSTHDFIKGIQSVGFTKQNDSLFTGVLRGVPVELLIGNCKKVTRKLDRECKKQIIIESHPVSKFCDLQDIISTFESYINQHHGLPKKMAWHYTSPAKQNGKNKMEYLSDKLIHYYSRWEFDKYDIWMITESLEDDSAYVVIIFNIY